MGEGKMQIFCDPISTITGPYSPTIVRNNKWVAMDDDNDIDINDHSISTRSSSSITSISSSSSSSLDLVEDASSSSLNTSSSSSSLNGPLYELSDLMAHLPIKRGLSKHFDGKSQSFTSLSNVSCIEDLAKRDNHFRKKMKTCKSHGGGLDIQKTISKKSSSSSRGYFASSLVGKRISVIGSPRPPIPAKKSF
ncbi:hypothetical protein BVC80_1791g37 [Macleaya cordata]|uniref:Oxidative stress 3 n=1 Tax=Macleaya cordata TaxID=56857 RepID=A0A200QPS8_MACCD|nr:hypothetical protein BVC80_1791g37 [Macleaya cordata]